MTVQSRLFRRNNPTPGGVGGPSGYLLNGMPVPKLALWQTALNVGFAGSPCYEVRGGATTQNIALSANDRFYNGGVFQGHQLLAYVTAALGPAHVTTYYDQSQGSLGGNDLAAPGPLGNGGPRVATGLPALELDASTPILNFDPTGEGGGLTLLRNDALAIGAFSPIVTAWKMRMIADLSTFPTFFNLGGSVTPEYCIFFTQDTLLVNTIRITNNNSGSVSWQLPLNSLREWHSYILIAPLGPTYTVAANWSLIVDGIDQGPPEVSLSISTPLGVALTMIGDFPGGGFPFAGNLAGLILWDKLLSADQTTQLQTFLDSQ